MQIIENNMNTGSLEQAIQILEEEIVLGFLHPRERLVEDDLLERFNLKRHVVRQLLVELERMGLVERKRNAGALVKSYTAKEVQDLYAVRELLECECARQIIFPVPPQALQAIIATQEKHDEMIQQGDLRGAFRSNMRFHEQLFDLADNAVLIASIRDLAQRAHSIRSSSLVISEQLERARQEHWQMIESLQQGDTEKLVKLCKKHLQPSRDNYIAAYHRRVKI